MHRWTASHSLYRDAARRVWERYRPSLLVLPVGMALLRDREVRLTHKFRALGAALGIYAGLLVLQHLVAWRVGLHSLSTSLLMVGFTGIASLLVFAPLALVRLSAPEHVVRVRLRRFPVIPLRRRL